MREQKRTVGPWGIGYPTGRAPDAQTAAQTICELIKRRDARQRKRSVIFKMIESETGFNKEFICDAETILRITAEGSSRLVSRQQTVALSKLVIDRVEAENENVVVDCSEVRNVGVRIKLPPLKEVTRNLDLAAEKSEALFRN